MWVLQTFSILIVVFSGALDLYRPRTIKYYFPGWKINFWAYVSNEYRYYDSPEALNLRYGKLYGKSNTIGCSINMQIKKMFFTKNRFTHGKDCLILLYIRNCFLRLKLLTSHLQKNIAFNNVKEINFHR